MMEIKNEDEENEPPLRREDDENKEEADDAPHLPPSHLEMEGNDQSIFRVNFPTTDDESVPTDEENQVIVSKNNNIGPTGYDDSHNTLNQTYDMSSDEDDSFPFDKKEEVMVVAVMAVMANEATTASDGSLTAGGSVHPSKPGHETFDNFTQRQKLVGGILATIALSTIIIGVTIFKKENERKVNELLLHMESIPTTSPSNMPSLSLIPTGSAHPTSRPSVEPTLYPTILSFQPFPRPSTMPSISIVPTISPSISFVPTIASKPTATPTQQPTSSMSRLKLYWQPGYLWQNINTEMFFCMECSNSNNACYQNDIIIINTCDTSASHQLFTIVGKTIRPAYDYSLCFTVMGYGHDIDNDGDPITQAIELQQCGDGTVFGIDDAGSSSSTNNIMQQFTGYNSSGKFEFSVDDMPQRCLAQAHHPKVGEKIHTKLCTDSREDTTSYYIAYE